MTIIVFATCAISRGGPGGLMRPRGRTLGSPAIEQMAIDSENCKLELKLSTYTILNNSPFLFRNLRHMLLPIPAPNPSLMSLSPHHPAEPLTNEERSFLLGGIYKQIYLIDREVCNNS